MSPEHVTVRIFGESYPIRTDGSAARLEELAGFVDARMRAVAASGKVVSSTKVAVLAALHIADELLRLRSSPPEPQRPDTAPQTDAQQLPADVEARLRAIVDRLDQALAPQVPEEGR